MNSLRYGLYGKYDAARGKQPQVSFRITSGLEGKGVLVDVVTTVTEAVESWLCEDRRPLYSQWLQLAQLPKKYQCEDSTTTSRQRAFWRTITGDPSFTSTPFLETKLDRATRVDMKAYETWLAMVHATAGPVASDEVERLELTATYGRSFFVTKDDHMGLCYPTAQAGDEVWVLYGGRLPFILRPRNEEPDSSGARYYTFIGDCYLDGFMDGRAVDNPLYDERTVTLR